MIFKAGKRTYFVIPKSKGTSDAVIKIANRYFKARKMDLEIQSGKMLDDETVKIGCKGDVWVVSRKGKA